MNAIKEAQKFIAKHPESDDARTLAQLVLTLESNEPFSLEKLYALDLDRFDLALDILKEWRLDRYIAGKSKLYDLSLQIQEQGPQDRTSHFGELN
ncbi:hypothetical protein [Rhodoferax sp. WC2427]|uniref:hypothetical protein n=1 Tax=Rhodoferax sp. WC2427 TaxID=3234144 RepID=UPI003464F6BE